MGVLGDAFRKIAGDVQSKVVRVALTRASQAMLEGAKADAPTSRIRENLFVTPLRKASTKSFVLLYVTTGIVTGKLFF